MNKLKGQTAIVTGGSSGIGSGIALALAAAGANVVVNYNSSEEGAQKIVRQITEQGGQAIAVGANVSQEEDVKRLFKTTLDTYGSLEILISNSGLQKDAAFVDMSLEDWETVISVNLTGAFLCAREAAKTFLKQGVKAEVSPAAGKIVFISSVHQKIPWGGHVNYAASKGGILQLMESTAQELAPKKIRINSIAPGAIKTPINTEAWDTEEARQDLLTKIPYGRIGEVEDIGKVAAWLVSDEADYITGTTIFVDGAMTNYPAFMHGG